VLLSAGMDEHVPLRGLQVCRRTTICAASITSPGGQGKIIKVYKDVKTSSFINQSANRLLPLPACSACLPRLFKHLPFKPLANKLSLQQPRVQFSSPSF